MLKFKNFDNLIYILISAIIFVTAGDFINDYKKLIVIKIIIILLIIFKINFIEELKKEIKTNEKLSIILILFTISITVSFIASPSKIYQFAYQWLRIRYLDNITDIFLFISFYLYFKDRNINYNNLIKSIIFPGLIFSIFVIYAFISNKGLSNNNKEILFFDGTRMVGMLVTLLVTFYLGSMHSLLQKKNIQNIFFLTTFMTLAMLLQGRGTIVAILSTYLFMSILLLFERKKFINEFLIFIFSICLSILLAQIIFHILSLSDDFVLREKKTFFYTFDRIELWKYGYIIFLESPYFGKGPGGFAVAAYNDFYAQKSYGDMLIGHSFTHNHPHNFVIQFLVEWGVIGTLLIFILLITLSIKSLKHFFIFKDYHLLIPGVSIVGLTSHGLIDGTLFHATFTFYFVLFLSILCSEISKKTDKNS